MSSTQLVLICERLARRGLDPMISGTGGILPVGIVGWYGYRRVTSDTSTATSLRVHNNA